MYERFIKLVEEIDHQLPEAYGLPESKYLPKTLEKHLKDLKENGTLLVDEDLVREVPKIRARVFKIPATKTAETKLNQKSSPTWSC
jgi:hypothetical protein